MLTSGQFWLGIIVGVALYWGYQRYSIKKASGN